MHQMGMDWHPKAVKVLLVDEATPMSPEMRYPGILSLAALIVLTVLSVSVAKGQSASGQSQAQAPANPQSQQDIPDAPSTVQPPAPKLPNATDRPKSYQGADSSSGRTAQQPDQQKPAPPPPMPPVETVPPGAVPEEGTQTPGPRNQINAGDDLYKLRVTTNFVQIPVMVKDRSNRLVYGLLYTDFDVLENGKPQKLTYFSSDPFELSVAIVLDLGMADAAVQKVNQTYGSLVGAFSPYDEFALYTYSSTVSQVSDFTRRPERLTAALDQIKL